MAGAIVTLVHGAQQTERWNKFCRDGWQAYAKKHGLELLVLDQPIDASEQGKARSPAWQKLLLGRAPVPKRYEQVAWVEPDVLINAAKAPNLFEHVPPGRIGAVAAHAQSADPLFADAFQKLFAPHHSLADYTAGLYTANGLPPVTGPLLNTAILACATRDLDWMAEIYERREAGPQSFQEQVFLSHEIARRNLLSVLDPRFGVEWSAFRYSLYGFANGGLSELKRLCLRQLFEHAYFLSLMGAGEDLPYFEPAMQLSGPTGNIPMEVLAKTAIQLGSHCKGHLQDVLLLNVAAWKRATVTAALRTETQNVVAAGPFAGMKLPAEVCWGDGDTGAKLLGTYEAELHAPLENVIRQQPRQIIMVGCSEGYYPIGFARRLPATTVWAFDTSPRAQQITRQAAELNGVTANVKVEGTCTPATLVKLLDEPRNTFLLIDCEGYELELLDLQKAPALAKCPFIVECHDFLGKPVTSVLRERLSPTHQVYDILEGARDPNLHPLMRNLHSLGRWVTVSENRPTCMNWLLCVPK